ncbi:MAG: rane protein [Myxococcaceae bacterium]|nr:rane protein [Myxococcaceae bacterium]
MAWIATPRILAAFGIVWTLAWWSRLGGGVLVLALMLAPAVIVPLGLALAASKSPANAAGELPLAYRAAVVLLPLDVAASAIGWAAPPGHRDAVLCALVHLVVCALVALFGLTRLATRMREGGLLGLIASPSTPPATGVPDLAVDVGLLLLPIGSVWLVAARAGAPLLGFHEPIVTLTAAHFHYAGFAAPVVLGCVGRAFALADGKTALAYRIATLTVCAAIPLTAIGITTTHAVEASAAVMLACGMLVACALLVAVVPRRAAPRSTIAAALFALAGLALLGTMGLAATFALTSSAGRSSTFSGPLPVQTMIDLHGGGNALGFAVCALVALTLVDRANDRAEDRE